MTVESPLVRQWILLRTLCARRYGATVKEMAEELGVSERTVRRDLETFQQSGFPLAEIVEKHGRKKWRVEPGKNQPGLTFTFDETIALYLGDTCSNPWPERRFGRQPNARSKKSAPCWEPRR